MPVNRIGSEDPEALLLRVLESSLDGIMAWRAVRDDTARIVDFEWILLNPRATELFDRAPDVLTGKRVSAEMPGLMANALLEQYARVVATGQRTRFEHFYEHGRVHVWLHIVVVKFGDGIAVTFSDISDEKRLEEQLLHSQKLEVIGRLAGGIAHDFNNLLTAISMNAEMALEALESPVAGRPEVQGVLDGVRRARGLTQQLLAFARRESGTPRVVRVDDLVHHCSPMLGHLLGSNVQLRISPSTDRLAVIVDPLKFEQVLTSLSVNAHDAMPDGGRFMLEVGSVVVRAGDAASMRHVAPGEYARIEAADNGVGMAADVLQHIFEPFFTTKGAGLGTGLGLATSYAVIRQAGGAMWATSTVGRGSTFTILLPRSHATPEAWPAGMAPAKPLPGTERVLVVDDEPAVLAVVSRTLGRLGYRTESAEHGEAALKLLERDAMFDLVLTDIAMPHMGGRELQRAGRSRFPALPILLMTGYEAGGSGDDGPILKKPFTAAELAAAVRDALHRGAAHN